MAIPLPSYWPFLCSTPLAAIRSVSKHSIPSIAFSRDFSLSLSPWIAFSFYLINNKKRTHVFPFSVHVCRGGLSVEHKTKRTPSKANSTLRYSAWANIRRSRSRAAAPCSLGKTRASKRARAKWAKSSYPCRGRLPFPKGDTVAADTPAWQGRAVWIFEFYVRNRKAFVECGRVGAEPCAYGFFLFPILSLCSVRVFRRARFRV